MKAILLDGSHANDELGEGVRGALATQLHAGGWEVEHIVLRERKIGNCAGDFFCWVRTPGICNVNDDNRAIAAALVASDLMVYLTPVTFGGYSSALKRMVDHQIQNLLPFFARIEGETHHGKRYESYPDFLAVGWLEAPDARAEAVFRHLVQRNALNWHAGTSVCGVVLGGEREEKLLASAQGWLSELAEGRSSRQAELPARDLTPHGARGIERALLLVGSPKTRKSTSNSLGTYLLGRLGPNSIQADTVYLHTVSRSPEKRQSLLAAVEAADLLVLAFPLYVDSLPAPVIEILELIAEHRKDRATRRQSFSAIANCGFPEAGNNATALAICELFARQAGFEWAGSLAMGGGQLIDGVSLEEGGGKTLHIRKGLELAAGALAQGHAIPGAAQDLLRKPVVPPWVYKLMGRWRWRERAKKYGAIKGMKERPYAVKDPGRGS